MTQQPTPRNKKKKKKPVSPKDRLKRLLMHPAAQAAGAALVACYLRFVFHTTRWVINDQDKIAQAVTTHGTVIVTFWHGRLMMMVHFWPHHLGRKMHVLISHHRDGALITAVCRHFRLGSVRGSSSRGGAGAAVAAIRRLQQGESIAITPDGPKGPAEEAKGGAILIASRAAVPLIPASYALSRYKCLNSWDKMILPLPFGRGAMCIEDLIHPHAAGDEAAGSTALTDALHRATRRAEAALREA